VTDIVTLLQRAGIQATPQRVAVARFVFGTASHPTADEAWAQVRRACPSISRATVYNTLNLLVEEGLLRTQILRGGTVVFDPRLEPHHHFVDERTGRIYDIPWEAVNVTRDESLDGFDVHEYQVVMRGRRRRSNTADP
jgi:Fe2+ or Zn2+ uptake regulation protein